MNFLEYKHSCDYNRLSFMQIYSSILKEKNNFVFSFSYFSDDYNLSLVKLSFFIIQIILYITFTCFFFTDDTINKIKDLKYEIKSLIYIIKPVVFTFIICLIINILLKALSKINNNVLEIKYERINYKDGLKKIRLKLIFYFIIGFIFISFGWALDCSFGVLFIKIYIKLLICSGITLIANFILQIIFCFIISSVRMCSLNSEKKGHKCLYNFSKILTIIFENINKIFRLI